MRSKAKTAIFLSDVHLCEPDAMKTKLLVRFFHEKAAHFDRLYVLGDLFDSWPATTPYLIKKFAPVLDTLKSLVDGGQEVKYIEGNHDFHLGNYFREKLGIRTYEDCITEEWGPLKIYLTHGDLGNPKDVGYRIFRKILRSPVANFAARTAPPEWIYRIGLRASRLGR